MKERVKELRAKVLDIERFYSLMEAASGQPEASKAFIDAQKARFPQPQTKEEAFITIGKLIAEGNPVWGSPLFQAWTLVWKDGKLVGNLLPLLSTSGISDLPLPPGEIDPAQLVPIAPATSGWRSRPRIRCRPHYPKWPRLRSLHGASWLTNRQPYH